MVIKVIRKVLLPVSNRFIYWLFFFLAFLINFAEGAAWYGWVVSPPLFGWFAVGMKSLFVYQSPLEFRHNLGRSIDILVGILVVILLVTLLAG